MKLLIGYLILINLAGFLSMGIDKQKARRGKYRISEKTLFLIASVGGSAGSIAGMYLFRHKTKHLQFKVGLPIILFLQIAVVLVLASSMHADAGKPSAAVRRELDRIKSLDDETLKGYLSLQQPSGKPLSSDEEDAALEAMRIFFDPFHYEITNEQINGDRARVTVNRTNLDTHSLAHDLCLSLTSRWIDSSFASENHAETGSYFVLLAETLRSHTYDTVSSVEEFSLVLEDHQWKFVIDNAVRDQIMGGLIRALRDPYLLSPGEILKLYLNAFSALDADGWIRCLKVNDLFSTESPQYAAKTDRQFFSLVSSFYAWEILDETTDGNTSHLTVRITSFPLKDALASYHDKLLSYAGTTDSITDGTEEIADTTALLLMEVLKEIDTPEEHTAEVIMQNDGTTWQIVDSSSLINAILGDLEGALEVMRS